jgi:hypothetical protein
MHNARNRFVLLATSVLGLGTLWQVGGCSFNDAVGFVKDFNPCLTIMACDPVAYRFLTSGYQGPGADPEIDPACTYPPFCNITTPGSDPFSP